MEPTPVAATAITSFTDERLLDLLLSAGDALPREAVEEFIRRRDRMIEPLSAICRDPRAWNELEEPLSWRPLHATFILGAIGGPAAVPGLIAALRHSAVADHDRVAEMIPSILGSSGPAALPPLLALARDRAAAWSERFEAILSIAALAARLGVKADVVYYWAQRGYLPTRRGKSGRRWVPLTDQIKAECRQRIAGSNKLPQHVKWQSPQGTERVAV